MKKEDKNLVDYVRDCLRKGLSHSQIARSIGMSLTHFENKLNYIFNEKPVEPEIMNETPVEEPVVGEAIEEPKPAPKKRSSKKAKTEQIEE